MFPGLPAGLGLALRSTHSMRITANILDLDHQPIATISNRILDGAVNGDLSGEVTRSATIVLLDPDSTLDFDSNSPSDGAVYADRMIQLLYGIRQDGFNGGKWCDIPIFTGPVVKFSRDGVRVNIECQGKELLARGVAWRTKTYKGGTLKTTIIEDAMRDTGERLFSIAKSNATSTPTDTQFIPPGGAAKVPDDRSIVPTTVPWAFVSKIAKGMGMQLYYDGAGRCVLRDWPRASAYTFATGTGGAVITTPKIDFTTDAVVNAVKATGKQAYGKGKTRTVSFTAVAPATHPLSPTRLGRNGKPRYLAEFINDDAIGSTAEARAVAEARLNAALTSIVTVSTDTLVVPHLDVGDYVDIDTASYSMTQRLGSFSIPLVAGATMALGYNRRLAKATRRSASK